MVATMLLVPDSGHTGHFLTFISIGHTIAKESNGMYNSTTSVVIS